MDVTRLGLVVDASGAQREIRLTTEQLKALANGGKAAGDALKNAIPPSVIPPDVPPRANALADAIKRMQQAAAQGTAAAFAARLGIEMEKASGDAMRLQRGLDGVLAAQSRMRAASAQGQANAMASQIAMLDPFQQSTMAAAAAAQTAGIGFEKMRGAMTQLAITASGLPGPLGRLGGMLGVFALGGGITIGVLAGIAAIGVAWSKITEATDRVREANMRLAESFKEMSVEARVAGLAVLQQREARLSYVGPHGERLEANGARATDFTAPAANRRAKELEDTRRLIGELAVAVAKDARDAAAKLAEARGTINRIGAGTTKSTPTTEGTMLGVVQEAERQRIAAIERVKDAERAAAEAAKQAWSAAHAQRMIEAEQEVAKITSAMESFAYWGVGKLAQAAGPLGGMVSGIGAGLISGNPYAAAAGGVMGLVDGLLNLSDAADRTQEAIRQARIGYESFMDSLLLQNGAISDKAAQIRELNRQRWEEEKRIRAAHTHMTKDGRGTWELDEEGARMLRDLNKQIMLRILGIKNETEAVERLNNAVRNAPSGFYVEKYLRKLGYEGPGTISEGYPGQNGGGGGGGGGSGGGTRGGGSAKPTIEIGEININGNRSGKDMVDDFLAEIRRRAGATTGNGGSIADALEFA